MQLGMQLGMQNLSLEKLSKTFVSIKCVLNTFLLLAASSLALRGLVCLRTKLLGKFLNIPSTFFALLTRPILGRIAGTHVERTRSPVPGGLPSANSCCEACISILLGEI